MPDFDFKRCARKCDASEREIAPGERYFSALIDVEEEIVRKDFSEAHWTEPPENCIGWWQSQVPVLEKGKIYWAPNRVLIAYFDSLTEKPDQKSSAYVMALLLVRKRLLQWKDSITRDEVEWMQLRSSGTKQNYEIEVLDLAPAQIQSIQDELGEQLFTDVVQDEGDPQDEMDEASS